jgi:hypothetical protein
MELGHGTWPSAGRKPHALFVFAPYLTRVRKEKCLAPCKTLGSITGVVKAPNCDFRVSMMSSAFDDNGYFCHSLIVRRE